VTCVIAIVFLSFQHGLREFAAGNLYGERLLLVVLRYRKSDREQPSRQPAVTGYRVTVFEAPNQAGGLYNGIPDLTGTTPVKQLLINTNYLL
jgi:hypothetical protein